MTCRNVQDGRPIATRWFGPAVNAIVRDVTYLPDGAREQELIPTQHPAVAPQDIRPSPLQSDITVGSFIRPVTGVAPSKKTRQNRRSAGSDGLRPSRASAENRWATR